MEVRWYLPEAEDFQQDRDDGTGSGESFSSRDITRKYRNQRNPDDDGSDSDPSGYYYDCINASNYNSISSQAGENARGIEIRVWRFSK